MHIDSNAREQAKTQWNTTACGELTGDKNTIEYFLRVEEDRYSQQDWMQDYFKYCNFSGKRVLEIGVGQGTDLMQFAKAGAQCFGVDITDNHLVITKRNFTLRNQEVDLRTSDATTLPFPDGYFDCVYSFGVLHHIPEIDKVMDEIHRVLKPGGGGNDCFVLQVVSISYFLETTRKWSTQWLAFQQGLCRFVGNH